MNKYLTIVAVLYAPFANTTKIAISQPTIDLCQPTNCSLLDFNGEHHTRFKVLETRGAHKRAGVCFWRKFVLWLGEEGCGSARSSAETKQLYAVLARGLSEHGAATPLRH